MAYCVCSLYIIQHDVIETGNSYLVILECIIVVKTVVIFSFWYTIRYL